MPERTTPLRPIPLLGAMFTLILIIAPSMSVYGGTDFAAQRVVSLSEDAITPQAVVDLPFPSWWSGECDTNHFRAVTGRDAVPLGGSFRGVKACGPLNMSVRTTFGGYGQFEWQCVELVMRFMWLAYGTPGYSASGKYVVTNYSAARGGTRLTKIDNGTRGHAPRPGDIVSFDTWDSTGALTTFGHTAIVTSATIDGNGNGTIRTLNQNSSWHSNQAELQGYLDFTVTNWRILTRNYAVSRPAIAAINWLTPESNLPPNPPQLTAPINGAVVNNRAVTLTWQDAGDLDNGPRGWNDFFVDVGLVGAAPTIKLEWKRQTNFAFSVPADGTYYWRVRAGDGGGEQNNGSSAWSPEWRFVVNTAPCIRKNEGDADCNGRIDLEDFEIFRQEFLAQAHGIRVTDRADFNRDGSVDLLDFELFREGYIKDRSSAVSLAGNNAVADTDLGEKAFFYLQQMHYTADAADSVDIDVFIENNPQTQISSSDLAFQYDAMLLEYDASASDYISPQCQNTNANIGYLNQRPSVSNDSNAGILRISRMSTADSSAMPYGKVCAGTFRFNVKNGIALPNTATVRLLDAARSADIAGPQAILAPEFDSARKLVTISIGATPVAPSMPSNVGVMATTNNSISLNWTDNSLDEDGFNIYKWDAQHSEWVFLNYVGPNIVTFTEGEVPCSTADRYRVSSFSTAGESGLTTELTAVTSDCYGVFLPMMLR